MTESIRFVMSWICACMGTKIISLQTMIHSLWMGTAMYIMTFMVGKNSIGICSDGETGEGLYYYDLSTDTYEKESIIYNGKELSLWRFCEIY